MGNSYFRFKQFTILQDSVAMKLGIDSVILGALANVQQSASVLDIGTGTGILALMLAQKNATAKITCIEIEREAYKMAKQNFNNSSWGNRITIKNCSIQNFCPLAQQKFDTIICNPPYFTENTKSNHESRHIARNQKSLSMDSLFRIVSELLSTQGVFYVIYPSNLYNTFSSFARQHALYINCVTNIKHTENHAPKRFVATLSFKNNPCTNQELIIKENDDYSLMFRNLTKDFYLNF